MAVFVISTEAFSSSASANTYKTILAIIGAASKRARLRRIHVSCGGETAHDEPMIVRINQTNQATAGTAGASPTPKPVDASSPVAQLTAGSAYSAEPTTYESTYFFSGGFNGRGYLDEIWAPDEAPLIVGAKTLGILIAPSTANARKVSATAYFEEF